MSKLAFRKSREIYETSWSLLLKQQLQLKTLQVLNAIKQLFNNECHSIQLKLKERGTLDEVTILPICAQEF
jgi:hypothetical protein